MAGLPLAGSGRNQSKREKKNRCCSPTPHTRLNRCWSLGLAAPARAGCPLGTGAGRRQAGSPASDLVAVRDFRGAEYWAQAASRSSPAVTLGEETAQRPK